MPNGCAPPTASSCPASAPMPIARPGLRAVAGMWEAVEEVAIAKGRPFLGICVGMQLMSRARPGKDRHQRLWLDRRRRQGDHAGRSGAEDPADRLEHDRARRASIRCFPAFRPAPDGLHAYFVHSYHLDAQKPDEVLAVADYGGPVTAAVARDNLVGTQFHPEKSQALGLALIANFLRWRPEDHEQEGLLDGDDRCHRSGDATSSYHRGQCDAPFAKYGAKFLVRAGRSREPGRTDRQPPCAWSSSTPTTRRSNCYQSPEYQHASKFRLAASTGHFVIVEGA